jgi:hypothetical protein
MAGDLHSGRRIFLHLNSYTEGTLRELEAAARTMGAAVHSTTMNAALAPEPQ